MWVVFKYKNHQYEFLKKNFKKEINNDVKFYNPKVKYSKNIKNKYHSKEKYILENYAFCYLEKFSNTGYLNKFKNIKGLSYFLTGCIHQQEEISKFVNLCIDHEKEDGTLSSSFFSNFESTKAKFLSGPFADVVFQIIERQKNKLKILLGNIETIVEKKSNILYLPL
tara:strand:+ start:9547 stop:10047 length:501 start_codon:yes stop_codon:yes gene_type:complete